jgi:hypothetical protein
MRTPMPSPKGATRRMGHPMLDAEVRRLEPESGELVASPDLLMGADRYDWRSIDTAPLDEDVTLLVRERPRQAVLTSVPVPGGPRSAGSIRAMECCRPSRR